MKLNEGALYLFAVITERHELVDQEAVAAVGKDVPHIAQWLR
jgi:hypothetical protein